MKVVELEEGELEVKKCCICGRKFKGYGNNPYPVKAKGRCCNECDATIVIPTRIKMAILARKKNEDK